ncbi:MAG: FlgD immunoglobulin-like domain containing protein [Candidatus Cloacimonadota bacterium]|nr:FlgD immunoglobulin-like domain containing protein [Candidatus Cloacimonadota bacterium]
MITNEDGYFEAEIYAFNYDCHVHLAALAAVDSLLSVAPGEENYYEFVFEDYVHTDEQEIPQPASKYHLSNYPNPFNPTTKISFVASAKQEDAKLVICNSRGQKIRELQICVKKGENSVVWNGNDDSGKSATSGVYLYKLVSQNKQLATNKMLLLK